MRFHRAWLGKLRAAPSRVALMLVMGLGLAMAGCVGDTSTPKGTIQTAAYAAVHGTYEDYKATLTGDALVRFGSHASYEQLGTSFGKVLSIGDARLVSHVQGDLGDGEVGDVLKTFRSEVSALTPQGAPIAATVDTLCYVRYETYHDPGSTGMCSLDPNDPGGPDICQPDTPPSDSEVKVQSCLVSAIALHGA